MREHGLVIACPTYRHMASFALVSSHKFESATRYDNRSDIASPLMGDIVSTKWASSGLSAADN